MLSKYLLGLCLIAGLCQPLIAASAEQPSAQQQKASRQMTFVQFINGPDGADMLKAVKADLAARGIVWSVCTNPDCHNDLCSLDAGLSQISLTENDQWRTKMFAAAYDQGIRLSTTGLVVYFIPYHRVNLFTIGGATRDRSAKPSRAKNLASAGEAPTGSMKSTEDAATALPLTAPLSMEFVEYINSPYAKKAMTDFKQTLTKEGKAWRTCSYCRSCVYCAFLSNSRKLSPGQQDRARAVLILSAFDQGIRLTDLGLSHLFRQNEIPVVSQGNTQQVFERSAEFVANLVMHMMGQPFAPH